MHETEYPIAIVTLGTKPQLATLLLHLLAADGVWVRELWLVHPPAEAGSAFVAAVTLLQRVLPQLFPAVQVRFVQLAEPDVDSKSGLQGLMDCLYDLFAQAKRADQVIHFGIAGGRRTMGMFGMVAAQLLFDERDCVWHIHSSTELEQSRRLLPDAADACYLVPVPVVQWSNISPVFTETLQSATSFSQALQAQHDLRLHDKFLLARAFVEDVLTAGEARVLAVAESGVSTETIAEQLSLSRATVDTHLTSIYRKAGTHWHLGERVPRPMLLRLVGLYYDARGKNQGFP